MKVSIVVPNYNHGTFLSTCLDSILNQTYQDYEVFICDNQSEDNSVEIASKYIEDPKFHLAIIDPHQPSGARGINDAIRMYSTGEICVWLNADDYFKENYLSTIVPYFKDPKIGFVRVAVTAWSDPGTTIVVLNLLPWNEQADILKCNKVYPPSPFRKQLFLDVGGIDEEARFYDWDFWAKCAFNMHYTHADCPKPLVVRRIHTGQWVDEDEEFYEKLGQTRAKYMQDGCDYIWAKYANKS